MSERIHFLVSDCKIKLETLNVKVPIILLDFLDGDNVDLGRVAQVLNAKNLEHNLKLGK